MPKGDLAPDHRREGPIQGHRPVWVDDEETAVTCECGLGEVYSPPAEFVRHVRELYSWDGIEPDEHNRKITERLRAERRAREEARDAAAREH